METVTCYHLPNELELMNGIYVRKIVDCKVLPTVELVTTSETYSAIQAAKLCFGRCHSLSNIKLHMDIMLQHYEGLIGKASQQLLYKFLISIYLYNTCIA